MEIVKSRAVEGLAGLHLARLRGDPRLLVEFVDTLEPGIPKSEKWVMMLSTQVGCPVGCGICDAGALGFQGNLTADEILDQLRVIVSLNGDLGLSRHPKVKVHLARMGEPSLNPHVLEALRFMGRRLDAPGLIPSLSTVAPKTPVTDAFFDDLIGVKEDLFRGGRFQLQFSLHGTDEASRAAVVPIRKWPLEEIAEYGARFWRPGDRRITLNFAPSPGAALDAGAIARVFSAERFLVKITPVNPTLTADRNGRTHLWQEPGEDVGRFADGLRRAGLRVIVSPSLPEEIAAATSCGQLWSQALREANRTLRRNAARDADCYAPARELPAKAASWLRAVAPSSRAPFEFTGACAALILVDMQGFFLDPRSPAYLPSGRAILGNALRLATAFRRAGRPVLFATHAYEDPAVEGGPMSRWWRKACLAGTPEARVHGVLAPLPGEPVLRKTRYSAFSNPELEPALRRAGVRELVVAGLKTNLCVEATARDAFERGFDAFIPADAAAASSEALHLASLTSAADGFARILSTRELLAAAAALEPRAAISPGDK